MKPIIDINLLLTIGGILLTIITFAFGYRKTIGAQHERIKTANDLLSTALSKHCSLSKHPITEKYVESLRVGQSIASGVKLNHIASATVLKDMAITKIFFNEYLSYEEKESSLKIVESSFDKQTDRSKDEIDGKEITFSSIFREIITEVTSPTATLGLISAATSIVAAIILLQSGSILKNFDTSRELIVTLTSTISITSLVLVLIVELRRRSSQTLIEFEDEKERSLFNEVQDLIWDVPNRHGPIEEVDYYFNTSSGDKVGIEVTEKLNTKLDEYLKQREIGKNKFLLDKVISITTPKQIRKFSGNKPDWFTVMTIDEFSKFLDEEVFEPMETSYSS